MAEEFKEDQIKHKQQNPYEILNVDESASDKELKQSFNQLSIVFHPDKVPQEISEQGSIYFNKIQDAYSTLKNPLSRFLYDKYGWYGLKLKRDFKDNFIVLDDKFQRLKSQKKHREQKYEHERNQSNYKQLQLTNHQIRKTKLKVRNIVKSLSLFLEEINLYKNNLKSNRIEIKMNALDYFDFWKYAKNDKKLHKWHPQLKIDSLFMKSQFILPKLLKDINPILGLEVAQEQNLRKQLTFHPIFGFKKANIPFLNVELQVQDFCLPFSLFISIHVSFVMIQEKASVINLSTPLCCKDKNKHLVMDLYQIQVPKELKLAYILHKHLMKITLVYNISLALLILSQSLASFIITQFFQQKVNQSIRKNMRNGLQMKQLQPRLYKTKLCYKIKQKLQFQKCCRFILKSLLLFV